MLLKSKLDHFNRTEYYRTHYSPNIPPIEAGYALTQSPEYIRKWKLACGYISLVPILILLILAIVTIISSCDFCHFFRYKSNRTYRIVDKEIKCNIRLVESIPEGLNYSVNDPKFMSTFDAWNTLLDLTKTSLDIGSFYWTMRGEDVVKHPTAAEGEAIFKRLLSNKVNKAWNFRIAQNIPAEGEPDIDTIILSRQGAAKVRSVDFSRLLGRGVLHTKLWISDHEHFYIGSANMDWRALTQVKELGVLGQNCRQLTQDALKIFEAYWLLGSNISEIPQPWPKEYSTEYNVNKPLIVKFNEKYKMSTYFSSSPASLLGLGRTNDVDAIISTILNAKVYVHIAVMDYFPLLIYSKKLQYWPHIDNAIRKAAIENNVVVKLLISWWKHSDSTEEYFLRSLTSLSNAIKSVNIQVKRFIVPSDEDQAKIPFARVNHNKYMVTDNTAYIGTSNWSGDYFTATAGIGLVLSSASDKNYEFDETVNSTIRDELSNVFRRDWNSPYAVPLQ